MEPGFHVCSMRTGILSIKAPQSSTWMAPMIQPSSYPHSYRMPPWDNFEIILDKAICNSKKNSDRNCPGILMRILSSVFSNRNSWSIQNTLISSAYDIKFAWQQKQIDENFLQNSSNGLEFLSEFRFEKQIFFYPILI